MEENSSDYAKEQDLKHKPIKVESSKPLSDGNNGEVPFHMCPTLHEKGATQSGTNPFGSFRETSIKVQEHIDEEKKISDMLVDPKATERILKLWSKPNPEAKNDELYGKHRNNISESIGGRRFTQDELNKSRGALPRFQNVKETAAAKDAKIGDIPVVGGYQARRQATTIINGLDWNEQLQLDSNRYMAWLGGQLTLQSQSKTEGFQKPRDVVNSSYYDKLMHEKDLSPAELYQLRKNEKDRKAAAATANAAEEEEQNKMKNVISEEDEEEVEKDSPTVSRSLCW